jgi:hypothetical protein
MWKSIIERLRIQKLTGRTHSNDGDVKDRRQRSYVLLVLDFASTNLVSIFVIHLLQ